MVEKVISSWNSNHKAEVQQDNSVNASILQIVDEYDANLLHFLCDQIKIKYVEAVNHCLKNKFEAKAKEQKEIIENEFDGYLKKFEGCAEIFGIKGIGKSFQNLNQSWKTAKESLKIKRFGAR